MKLNIFSDPHSVGAEKYNDYISAEGYDSHNECPENDIKQSNSEALVMLELIGMQCTPSLKFLLMGKIEQNCAKLNWLK